MSGNFRISICHGGNGIHLKLTGDFDGNAAMELIETLKNISSGNSRIFIHTSGLGEVFPSGKDVLENYVGTVNTSAISMIFTGGRAGLIAPGGIAWI